MVIIYQQRHQYLAIADDLVIVVIVYNGLIRNLEEEGTLALTRRMEEYSSSKR